MTVPTLNLSPNISHGRSLLSIPILVAALLLPMIIVATIIYYVAGYIAGIPVVGSFAVSYMNTIQTAVTFFDTFFFLLFAMAVGSIIVRSFRSNTHPVLAVVGLLFVPAIVIFGAMISNGFQMFSNISIISSAVNNFQYSALFLQNLPSILAVVSSLVLIVMVGGRIFGGTA